MKTFNPRSIQLAIAGSSLIVILLMIVLKTKDVLYDEHYFIPNVFLIGKAGLSKQFLLKMTGSPGPTYAVIHSLFSCLTHNSVMGFRLVNFGLLLILMVFIYLNAKMLRSADPLITAANFIFIPMVWVVCGLALTEVPTMFCAMVSLFFLLQCFTRQHRFSIRILFAVLAGLFLSFAVLGRSFFLMSIFALTALGLVCLVSPRFVKNIRAAKNNLLATDISNRQLFLLLAIVILVAAILPVKVFSVWKALAPPTETKIVGANNVSLVPWHGILSLCYCGFVALILNPRWFVINKKVIGCSLVLSLAFLLLNFLNGYVQFAPFLTAASRFLSPRYFSIYQRAIPALIVFFSINFLFSILIIFKRNIDDPVTLYIGVTALLIAFSAAKVQAQFSSRYVAQIVPYFVLLFIPYETTNWGKVIRASVGAALGFLSLYFYY